MSLLTKEQEEKLLNAPEDSEIVLAKFVSSTGWAWYAVSAYECYNGEIVCFGFVSGLFPEWGDFPLSELESVGDVTAVDIPEGLTVREHVKRDCDADAMEALGVQ